LGPIVAPASSTLVFIFFTAAFQTASFTVFGAPSTKSLASFNHSPVTSRTIFMASIALSRIDFPTTSNSVFSSAPGESAATVAVTAGATTGAAVLTPNLASGSLTKEALSNNDYSLNQSIIVSSINTCRGITHWILAFGFHVNISLECGPFEKLNRPNHIPLCGF
jgi:hypothetical protein